MQHEPAPDTSKAGSASVRSLNHAEVRVREPLGERLFVDALGAGGEGADLVLPGCASGNAMHIARRQGAWTAGAVGVSPVRVNGQLLLEERHLTLHDVLAIGDAQLIVTGLSRTLLRLQVQHLAGNSTMPPERVHVPISEESEDLEITALEPAAAVDDISTAGVLNRFARRGALAWQHAAIRRAALILMTLLVLAALLVSQLSRVPLHVEPARARIRTPGTLLALHLGAQLYLLPGNHVVRAMQTGYGDAETIVQVTRAGAAGVHLVLQRLPGVLVIDTNGVAATISIDGVESGQAPGTVRAPAGTHTLTLRAPHYVDDIESVAVMGGGQQQSLSVKLQPSWGTLQILSSTPGALVKVDGVEHGGVPATVQVPSGVRRVLISAPGRASWESSVVLKAATVLTIGPVALGQPGVQLRLSSDPAGAAVTLDGELRGRTPLATEVASGVRHEINISLSGYSPWQRETNGNPGQTLPIHAQLQAETVRLTVEGEPQAAHVFIDGRDEGAAPRVLQLSAAAHQVEVSKPGWATYKISLAAAAGLDRHIQYHLLTADAAARSLPAASIIYTQTGYALQRVQAVAVPAATGREGDGAKSRGAIGSQLFYLGIAAVSNEQFRHFRVDHATSAAGNPTRDPGKPTADSSKSAMDPDGEPVTRVSWEDAVRFCNWLSEHDSLPPAYERSGDEYVLRKPATIGYRLPTAAELRSALSTTVVGAAPHIAGEWVNDHAAATVNPSAGSSVSFRVARNAD